MKNTHMLLVVVGCVAVVLFGVSVVLWQNRTTELEDKLAMMTYNYEAEVAKNETGPCGTDFIIPIRRANGEIGFAVAGKIVSSDQIRFYSMTTDQESRTETIYLKDNYKLEALFTRKVTY